MQAGTRITPSQSVLEGLRLSFGASTYDRSDSVIFMIEETISIVQCLYSSKYRRQKDMQ